MGLFVPHPAILPIGVNGVRDQVGGEKVNFDALHINAGPAQALVHKDLAVKTPEATSQLERGEVNF